MISHIKMWYHVSDSRKGTHQVVLRRNQGNSKRYKAVHDNSRLAVESNCKGASDQQYIAANMYLHVITQVKYVVPHIMNENDM